MRSLVDLASVRSGIAKNSKRELHSPVLVHYLRVANVQDGYLDLSEMSTIRVNRDGLSRYAVLPGDVLMNEGGDLDKLGRGAMWHGEFSPCVHQNHVFVVRCAPPLLPQYLDAWTGAAPARRYFVVAGKQTTNLASINKTALGRLPVVRPPLPEQRAIAEALSDVDGLLGALEALIAKKRAIKQAAMQQLLTGKTRLPGFSGEWETKRLRDACALKSGEEITSPKIDDHSPYPCYGGNGLRGFTTTFTHHGDFALIGRQGALCGNVVRAKGEFYASEHALVVTARPAMDILWLAAVLSDMNLNQYSESSAQPGLSAEKLLVLEISSPPTKEEQSAIATVLSDIDAEIAALERRRDKTRAIKQGMMQQLLTGRVRLVEPTPVETGA